MAVKSKLARVVRRIKDDAKAQKTPSTLLKSIIDAYCVSGCFDDYLWQNRQNVMKYFSNPGEDRSENFRASAAGECAQAQAYTVLVKKGLMEERRDVPRPAKTMRALYNGTFFHVRCHMMFDALDHDGVIETLYAEKRFINKELSLGGTVDRGIALTFNEERIEANLDFKSMASKYFNELYKPSAANMAQQHAYHLLGARGTLWMMLYENKDTHEMMVFDFPYSEIELHRLKRQYDLINAWVANVENKTMQTVTLPLITDWCNWCPFNADCLKDNPGRDDTPTEEQLHSNEVF